LKESGSLIGGLIGIRNQSRKDDLMVTYTARR
jgi:hypothetical protein